MAFPVNKFLREFQQFCVVNEAFTQEEVDKILDLEDLNRFQKGAVGSADGKSKRGEVVISTRDSEVMWIHPDQNSDWLFRKFSQLCSFVNYDHFMYDISHFDAFQYTVYNSNTQQHYDWHLDVGGVYENYERKLSVSICLSDPNEYEGGDFVCILNGKVDQPYVARPPRGDAIFFPSWVPHKVTPVTAGVRKSLVCWVQGPKK